MAWNYKIKVTCPTCSQDRTILCRRENEITDCRKCAAVKRKAKREWNLIHGESQTPLYAVWASMKRRCLSPKQQSYRHYGGRGISVCQQWIDSWESFRDWALANGYEKGKHLDRTENNGNYEPQNCRWVDKFVSARNRRSSVIDQRMLGIIKELHRQGYKQKDMAYVFGLKFQTVSAAIHSEAK